MLRSTTEQVPRSRKENANGQKFGAGRPRVKPRHGPSGPAHCRSKRERFPGNRTFGVGGPSGKRLDHQVVETDAQALVAAAQAVPGTRRLEGTASMGFLGRALESESPRIGYALPGEPKEAMGRREQ